MNAGYDAEGVKVDTPFGVLEAVRMGERSPGAWCSACAGPNAIITHYAVVDFEDLVIRASLTVSVCSIHGPRATETGPPPR